VAVDLPRASSTPQDVKPDTIRLSVDAQGRYFWNEQPLAEEQLLPRLQAEARRDPQPELHLRGDKDARYERVAQALAAAQRSGLRRIGFITEPKTP
jgi:biopolymer transport protein ExbD